MNSVFANAYLRLANLVKTGQAPVEPPRAPRSEKPPVVMLPFDTSTFLSCRSAKKSAETALSAMRSDVVPLVLRAIREESKKRGRRVPSIRVNGHVTFSACVMQDGPFAVHVRPGPAEDALLMSLPQRDEWFTLGYGLLAPTEDPLPGYAVRPEKCSRVYLPRNAALLLLHEEVTGLFPRYGLSIIHSFTPTDAFLEAWCLSDEVYALGERIGFAPLVRAA